MPDIIANTASEKAYIDYRSHEALNASGIKEILKSPAHYVAMRRRQLLEQGGVPSEALRRGSAIDNLILDPSNEYAISVFQAPTKYKKNGEPYVRQATGLDTAEGQAFVLDHPGRIPLTMADYEFVRTMAERLWVHPIIKAEFRQGQPKVRVFTELPSPSGYMIPVKAEFDYLRDDAIVDLKTTADDVSKFPFAARKYRYDIQAAWYQMLAFALDGKMRRVLFVAAEKFEPFECALYEARQSTIESARIECERAMDLYAESLNSGVWTGYTHEPREF